MSPHLSGIVFDHFLRRSKLYFVSDFQSSGVKSCHPIYLGSFLIIFGSNFFFGSPEKEKEKISENQEFQDEFTVKKESFIVSDEKIINEEIKNKNNFLKIENNLFKGEISLVGGYISNLELKNFYVKPSSNIKSNVFSDREYLSKIIFKAKDFEINTK